MKGKGKRWHLRIRILVCLWSMSLSPEGHVIIYSQDGSYTISPPTKKKSHGLSEEWTATIKKPVLMNFVKVNAVRSEVVEGYESKS